ncbi:MAG: hypothetical protein ACLQU9_09410 [Acidimicrobiales bacterium]
MLRASAVLVAALFVGAAFAGCGGSSNPGASGTTTTSGTATSGNSGSATTSGGADAAVASVSAVVQPKSPLSAKAAPAERVTFRVSSGHGPLSCTIEVFHAGRVVGSTVAQIGSSAAGAASSTDSVAVEGIKGGTFAGTPSDATVVCSAR